MTSRRVLETWVALALLAGVATTGQTTRAQDPPAEGRGGTMSDELGLTPDDYWAAPQVGMVVFRKLREENFQGIKIGAPPVIATDLRETSPMLLYRAGSYRDLAELDFTTHAVVTIMDLERNRVTTAYAAKREPGRPPVRPSDPATAQAGYTAAATLVDLNADCHLSRQPGTYLVAAVMRDRVSNRLRIQVQRSAATFQDPEVARVIRQERARIQAPAITPGLSSEPQTGTPAVPEAPGLAMVVDRVTVQREGASCVLRGAFRVAAQPEETVKPGELAWLREGALRPTAVVRLHVLVVGSDKPAATVLTLDVPSYDPVDPKADAPIVTGQFNLDLLAYPRMPKAPKTYFLYGFAGEAMTGPHAAAFVAADAIPQQR